MSSSLTKSLPCEFPPLYATVDPYFITFTVISFAAAPARADSPSGMTPGVSPIQKPMSGVSRGQIPATPATVAPGMITSTPHPVGSSVSVGRPGSGAQRPPSGTQRPTSGTQRPTSGTQRPSSGTQRPSSGTQRPSSGTQRPNSGTQRPGSGQERPHLDDLVSDRHQSASQPAQPASDPGNTENLINLGPKPEQSEA